MFVTLAVSYLPTGLAGCLVGLGISCGVRKLTRTSRVKKKNMRSEIINQFFGWFDSPGYTGGVN